MWSKLYFGWMCQTIGNFDFVFKSISLMHFEASAHLYIVSNNKMTIATIFFSMNIKLDWHLFPVQRVR